MGEAAPKMLIDSEDDPAIHAAIFDTIENQIRDGEPAETAATLQRLMSQGLSRERALGYIGCALSVEFFEIVEHQGAFDLARYVANLRALPALPYDESEI